MQSGLSSVLLASGSSLPAAAFSPAAGALARHLSVLSWGRNVEGQCGVETSVVVMRPTPVMELQGVELAQLCAGKVASGAVSAQGEAVTWGCGRGGKLGHGNADPSFAPARVESLYGRADVSRIAMGEAHTLFSDTRGGLWSCGENKEGQCGLGTPLEVIAQQHRKAFQDSFKSVRDAAALGAVQQSTREQKVKKYIQGLMNPPSAGQQAYAGSNAMHMQQAPRSSSWQHATPGARSMPQITSTPDGARMALGFHGFDPETHFGRSGLQPGQQHTPMRIGRDSHPLMNWYHNKEQGKDMLTDAMPGTSGLEHEVVTEVSASRYFSVALTQKRDVWTFGACYNGALGSSSSWSTSAQKVSGPLASVLEELGGAVSVAAGGTFCVALTEQGKVVVWGKLMGGEGRGSGMLSLTSDGVTVASGSRITAGVIPGLPRITHIAAGQQHALLSDGERVWALGRWMGKSGVEVGSAHWSEPKCLLTLEPGQQLRSLVCGPHSNGVVTECGQLYMWGRLLDRHQVDGLVRRYMQQPADTLPEDFNLDWAGFGADMPTRVDGLSGPVQGVALGGWHAVVSIA